jgi:hypothetical protein
VMKKEGRVWVVRKEGRAWLVRKELWMELNWMLNLSDWLKS